MALDLTLAINATTAGTGVNTTITKPTGTVTGDLVIAWLYVEDDVAVSAPDGTWTLIGTVDHPGQPMDLIAWWKVAGAGEPANWTWTHASAYRQGGAYRITGAPASAVIDGTPTTNTGTGTTATFLAVTTAQANSGLVGIVGEWTASATGSFTSPLTERSDTTQFSLASGVQAAAGSSGNKTCTETVSTEWFTIFFAVKDAAETPSQDTPELRGRPFGLHGQQQMAQLLAH